MRTPPSHSRNSAVYAVCACAPATRDWSNEDGFGSRTYDGFQLKQNGPIADSFCASWFLYGGQLQSANPTEHLFKKSLETIR